METNQQNQRPAMPPPEVCPQCGLRYDPRRPECPRCGAQNVQNTPVKQIPDEIKEPKSKPRKKTVIIGVCVIIIALIAIVAALFIKSAQNKKIEDYKDKISDFISLSAVAGESIDMTTDIVTDVWYATIAGYTKAKTDIAKNLARPAKLNKDYDFNDALNALYDEENFINMINTCQKSCDEALEKLKELANPPTRFEPLYQKAREIYDQLDGAMDLLKSPRGSYDSYSKETYQNLTDINSRLRSLNNELDLMSN